MMPLEQKDFIVEEEMQIKFILHNKALARPVFYQINEEVIICFLSPTEEAASELPGTPRLVFCFPNDITATRWHRAFFSV